MTTVALDALGGDHGPTVVIPAARAALERHPDLEILLVGPEKQLATQLGTFGVELSDRLSLVHASQAVDMDEPPAHALRGKRDSSMRVAVNLVQQGRADACVSAGNTGALMAIGRFVLRTLPGIDRPAIISKLPALKGHTRLLDLGANVEPTPEQLYQFGVMGAALASAIDDIEQPRIGLLNIGEEAIKGNERVKRAGLLLAGSELNYIGFVEGDDIYKGSADVIVCDGFAGNVALKSSEGVARMIAGMLREQFNASLWNRAVGLLARPVLNALKRRIDPSRYNGATLLGLRGVVIKSHGSADALAFETAIRQAISESDNRVPERIASHLARLLAHEEAV